MARVAAKALLTKLPDSTARMNGEYFLHSLYCFSSAGEATVLKVQAIGPASG